MANLNALYGLPKDAPDQVYLSLVDIDPNPDQPRTIVDDEELEALAESMKSSGLLQPIGVRKAVTDDNKTVYTLIYGQRRLAAARLLGWEKIMALSFKGGRRIGKSLSLKTCSA
jgi:ParB family transcriptional regulator, chromosome partitioning protein